MYSLVGVDGNAYSIMGYTMNAMRREKFSEEDVDKMLAEAKSGDYNNLICVCCDWISKVNEKAGLDEDDE